jgi:periplasmic divalent cation tolerance protein
VPTLYVTVPPESAADIAESLVEERLAACVNRVDCRSVYRWQDEVHRDDEVILLAKTTDDRYDRLVERLLDLHPYEMPAVERFDETEVPPDVRKWRDDAVSPPAPD